MKTVWLLWVFSIADEVRIQTPSNLLKVFESRKEATIEAEKMSERIGCVLLEWKGDEDGNAFATNRYFRYTVKEEKVHGLKTYEKQEEEWIGNEGGWQQNTKTKEWRNTSTKRTHTPPKGYTARLTPHGWIYEKDKEGGVQNATPVTPPNPPSNPRLPAPPAIPDRDPAWKPHAI